MPKMLADVREPVNTLYYGDGGTGKTTDMLTMSNLGKIWVCNAESGVKSRPLRVLADEEPLAFPNGVEVGNIEIWPDPDTDERITFGGLEAEWLRIREALDKDPDAYVGTVWDSITEIYKALLDSIVAEAVTRAERAGKERDRFFTARDDYQVMSNQVRDLVRKFRDLPCHFAVSALMRREQDDDGAVVYQPAITPALQNDLIGWVDQVCVTSVAMVDGQDEYRGLFRPHNKFRGKDRLRACPKWLVAPTFERIVGYVEGELDVDSDPVMQDARKRAEKAKKDEVPAAVAAA